MILNLLKKADYDISYALSIKNTDLYKLLSIKKEFGKFNAQKVIQECLVSVIKVLNSNLSTNNAFFTLKSLARFKSIEARKK